MKDIQIHILNNDDGHTVLRHIQKHHPEVNWTGGQRPTGWFWPSPTERYLVIRDNKLTIQTTRPGGPIVPVTGFLYPVLPRLIEQLKPLFKETT